MAGQAVIVLIRYLNGVIKRISGRTGASPWFCRYTCGFSVAQFRNDNASCLPLPREDGEAAGPRGTPSRNRTLSRGATRSAVQQLRLSTVCNSAARYIGNYVFRRLEKILYFMTRV